MLLASIFGSIVPIVYTLVQIGTMLPNIVCIWLFGIAVPNSYTKWPIRHTGGSWRYNSNALHNAIFNLVSWKLLSTPNNQEVLINGSA